MRLARPVYLRSATFHQATNHVPPSDARVSFSILYLYGFLNLANLNSLALDNVSFARQLRTADFLIVSIDTRLGLFLPLVHVRQHINGIYICTHVSNPIVDYTIIHFGEIL